MHSKGVDDMLENKIVFVVGGDLRQAQLARLLSQRNTVYTFGLEKADGLQQWEKSPQELQEAGTRPDYIVFPMPVGSDEETVNTPFSARRVRIEDALSPAGPGTCVLGGKLSPSLTALLDRKNLSYTDYFQREELSVLNAIPTAEGAVQIAMEELPTTIFGLRVLVIGYGRIGKVLSRLLRNMGADVTVSARKFSDLAWIEAEGFHTAHTHRLTDVIPACGLIVNTVPVSVLDETLLALVPEECLLIDLASKPGGIDCTAANRLGRKAIWALSLPGKVAPATAGTIIFNTLQNIDAERGGNHVEN